MLARALSLYFAADLLGLLPVTRGQYTIDDANSVVQYTPISTTSSFGWVHSGMTSAFNSTISNALCNTADNCSITIPFDGSGIIIYGYLYGDPLVFTVSLDGEMAPPPPTFSLDHNQTNVTLYEIQPLPLTNHTLTITLGSSNNAPSRIYFDYAWVNTTAPPPGSSPTVNSLPPVNSASAMLSPPAASSSSTQPASYQSHFPLGAVVGGSLGGLAIVGILLALLYLWRKRHIRVLSEIDPDPHHDSEYRSSYAPSQTVTYTPFMAPPASSLYSNRPTNFVSEQQNTISRVTSPSIANSLVTPAPPMSTADSTELSQSIPSTEKNPDDYVTPTHSPGSLSSSSARNQLTDAQVDFVTSLHAHNVPAPTIARIVQSLIAGQEIGDINDVSTVAHGHDAGRGDTTGLVAPPSYSES